MTTPTQALAHIFALLPAPKNEIIPLRKAAGRVLAAPAIATRDLPPFPAAAMDGYALNGIEADPEAMFRVIGEAAAGHGFSGHVGAGECVRIFTGAPMPEGANRVIMQEQATRRDDLVTLACDLDARAFTRAQGSDFAIGDKLEAPRVLSPDGLALLASMNINEVTVTRRPIVAILPTGDELVMPGEDPRPDQIIASNAFGLKALVEGAGGKVRMLPIARDNKASLGQAFALAKGVDLIVTTGGASVGDHDIVADVGKEFGLKLSFSGLDMRPGKPMMAGGMGARMGNTPLIGLPGSPYAVMVLGRVFLVPAVQAMLGLGEKPAPLSRARLTEPLRRGGRFEQFLTAQVSPQGIAPLPKPPGSLMSPDARGNALLHRAADDIARETGEIVEYLPV